MLGAWYRALPGSRLRASLRFRDPGPGRGAATEAFRGALCYRRPVSGCPAASQENFA